MTRLTFYGGINEIGGNKFLLEDGSSRVFLDFGKNFGREKQYFDEPWIRPQREEHLLALGILPNLPGIYKKDAGAERGAGAGAARAGERILFLNLRCDSAGVTLESARVRRAAARLTVAGRR